jgi:polar amino acid transport system substrate-binding protein
MSINKSIKLFFLASFAFILFLQLNPAGAQSLTASLAELPGLAETSGKGAFVDFVKAMDEVYTEGTINIVINPFARSIDNAITGKADFHMPIFKNPQVPVSKLPYGYITETIGKTAFVLYSNVDKPITAKMIKEALAKGGQFPYKIETGNGVETNYNFPLLKTDSIEQSFQKLKAKRIDALLWAQEEADIVLKQLRIKTVYRAHMNDFNDTLLIRKGPEGEKLDKILSAIIVRLRKAGKLDELFLKIHKPYDDWQPAKMDW